MIPAAWLPLECHSVFSLVRLLVSSFQQNRYLAAFTFAYPTTLKSKYFPQCAVLIMSSAQDGLWVREDNDVIHVRYNDIIQGLDVCAELKMASKKRAFLDLAAAS